MQFGLSVQALKKEFQTIMKKKNALHSWPSTSHEMEWQQVGAAQWLYHYMSSLDANLSDKAIAEGSATASLTMLLGNEGHVVASVSEGRAMLVLAKSHFSFLAWDLEVVGSTETDDHFSIMKPYRRSSLHWHHVTNLDNWVEVPVKPVLLGATGPLALEQIAGALFLPYARIAEGLSLTNAQCKFLLGFLKVPHKKNESREVLHNRLLDYYLETEADKAEARRKMGQHMADEAEDDQSAADDTDYEDLLHFVEEQQEGDPDVKKEKERVKMKKRKTFQREALAKKPVAKTKAKGKDSAKPGLKIRRNRLGLKRNKAKLSAAGTGGTEA